MVQVQGIVAVKRERPVKSTSNKILSAASMSWIVNVPDSCPNMGFHDK